MILFTEASAEHENEDAVLVRALPDSPGWIGAVADGQGGQSGGGKAAQLACRAMTEATVSSETIKKPGFWWDTFRSVDQVVSNDKEAGLTTLVGFGVFNGFVYGASCGDSAAYLLNAGVQLVELTAGQQKNPQVGSGMSSCIFFSSPLAPPWSLLVMTDGVWKYVGRNRIVELLKTMRDQEFASSLEAAGRLPGSGRFPDDFSFALLEG